MPDYTVTVKPTGIFGLTDDLTMPLLGGALTPNFFKNHITETDD
ncbi:MAG: hypothetical protein R2874_08625 [Desulfobacterales bacterium]